jgi:phage-related protein (TIGR01555 family)
MTRIIKRWNEPEFEVEEESIVADWSTYGGATGQQSSLAGNAFSENGQRSFLGPALHQQQLLYYYIYSQPIANAIDIVPDNALKGAPTIVAKDASDQSVELIDLAESAFKSYLPVIRHLAHFSRLYGWAIMPIFTEEDDLSTAPDYLKSGGIITDVRAVAGGVAMDAQIIKYWDNPRSRNYGMPMTFRITPGEEVHVDRCVIMSGLKDKRPLKNRGVYSLGYSLVEPLYKPWDLYVKSICANLKILESKGLEIIKLPNLKQIMRKPKELTAVLEALMKCRKAINGYILDAEGDFQSADKSLTGINDSISQFLTFISMQGNLPDTIFFGISPAGLTSGSYETGVLNNLTAIYQKTELEPVFRQVADTIFLLNGKEDMDYKIKFPNSSETTEVERSEIDAANAKAFSDISSALQVLVNLGVMTKEVAAAIAHHAADGSREKIIMSQIDQGDPALLPDPEDVPAAPQPQPALAPSASPSGAS